MDSPEQQQRNDESTFADSTLQPPPGDDDGTLATEAFDDAPMQAFDDAPIQKEDVAPFEIGDAEEDEETGPVRSNQHSLPDPEELKVSQLSQGSVTQGCGKMLCWMSIIFVLVIALTVGLAVGLTNQEEGKPFFSGYNPFTPITREKVGEAMKQYIVDNGVSPSGAFYNPSSPQSIALDFLANKDPMQLNAPLTGLDTDEGYSFISRYVMALFYAAMGGDTWNYDLLFLSKHDTCDWYDVFQPPVGQVGVLCNQNTKKIVGLSFSK